MNVKIADVMVKNVVTTQPHKSLGHAKEIMERNNISCVPVVNTENEVVGIVSATDLTKGYNEGTPVNKIMPEHVYTVPAYNNVHIAARIMRNHKIHHVVVTHEGKIVGIISSFDLLKLVDDHRFVMKSPPKESNKSSKRY